ncbi:MAG TPA: PAS domain-containing protein [Bradyrhizobium sp.]|nr:PAS domain-containing protein [Bradyrhizobium sp.]
MLVVCRDVTKEYLSAVALREREAELARVQQIGRIGGLEVDLTTGFRNRRSPEYLLIHGLPLDAANESHEDWVRRIHPEDREATEKKFRDAVAGTVRDYTVRYRIIRPSDGETRWISVKSTIERDEQGRAIRLVGAHTDVTEQVMAEQALRQSEERYRRLADQLSELNATLAQRVEEKTRERDRIWNVSQDLLVVADRNGVWRTVNPAWTRTLGWSEAELLNRTSEWLEHPDDGGMTRAEVNKLGVSDATVRFESRFRHKDGSYRWLSWTGVPDRDHIYAVARDVTAEKAAAERLKAAEEALLQSQKMEAVGQLTGGIAHDFNNLLTGIVGSLDLLQTRLNQGRTDNVARYINAAMTSANRAAALTHRLLAFARRQPLIPECVDANQLVVSLEDLLRRTIGESIDLEIAASDDLWRTLCDPNQLESALLNLAINARDAMPDGGKLAISTANAHLGSVTAEQAAAERLKVTEEALLQSQKMEAVGQLTGGIAHDFNNLLTGIVGSLDLLQTRLNQGRTDNVARYIDAAMTSANRAAALTHRLLAFARRQPLIPKSVDANQLVVSLEDLLRRTIGETIDLAIAAADDLWFTLCDPNQLESALLNLAINARDAMPDGGKLTITTSNARIEGVTADGPALSPGDYICISVTDTGMSAEVAARAFDPFFTTKPIGQGTGLGLSMIYGFARQSDGHVTIDSKLGRGTSVRLYLPRHHGEIVPQFASAATAAEHAATGETVLIVEDEPVVRAVIVEMLGEQGYQTLEASDGPSGLRVLRTNARIDLLVTDVGLPGMNGRQLADQARETRPGLKVLFITGYAESVAISDGFLQPGMEMVTKPFDLDNLSQRIRAMVSS